MNFDAIAERYHRALDAKPGKGPISEAGIVAITDSVCDVPTLLERARAAEAERDAAREERDRVVETWPRYCEHGSTPDYLCQLLRSGIDDTRARAEVSEAAVMRVRRLADLLSSSIITPVIEDAELIRKALDGAE